MNAHESFLESTFRELPALLQRTDILQMAPVPPLPPSTYLCRFLLPYLRQTASGVIDTAGGPVDAAIHIPYDYLISVDRNLPLRVVTVVTSDVVHPNIAGGCVCLGSRFAPATPIGAVVEELYDILAFRNYTVNEANALDPVACRFVRDNPATLRRLHPPPFFRQSKRLRIIVEEPR